MKNYWEQYQVNINGTLHQGQDATISVFDRGFLFGDSIYEVTRTYNGIPFLLDEHFDRLWNSANLIHMGLPYSRQYLTEQILTTIHGAELNKKEAFIRLIITRGVGEIGLDPDLAQNTNLIIFAKEQPINPSWWYQQGVEIVVAKVERNPKKALDPNVKSGNYLNNVMAMIQAKEKKTYDAVMLNSQGHVTECSTSNVWIVKGNQIFTPPLSAGILKGITRTKILELLLENKYQFAEKNITAEELKNADECFLTSSTKEIIPVVKIDDQIIGQGKPGIITNKIHNNLKDYIQKYCEENKSMSAWL